MPSKLDWLVDEIDGQFFYLLIYVKIIWYWFLFLWTGLANNYIW